jgi:hypothetical protein
MEIAGVIAAQVVAIRGHGAVAVSPIRAVRDNGVLEGYVSVDAAAITITVTVLGEIPAHSAVVDRHRSGLRIDPTAVGDSTTKRTMGDDSAIPAQSAVVEC